MDIIRNLSIKTKVTILISLLLVMMLVGFFFYSGGTGDKELNKAVNENKQEQKVAKKEIKKLSKEGVDMYTQENLYTDYLKAQQELGENKPENEYINKMIEYQPKEEQAKYSLALTNSLFYQESLTEDQFDIQSRKFASVIGNLGYEGIAYRTVLSKLNNDKATNIENGIKYYSSEGYIIQPTTDGFEEANKGEYVGYPTVVPIKDGEESYLAVYIPMYFSETKTWEQLKEINLDVSFEGMKSESYNKVADLPNDLGNFNNTLNSDFLYNYIDILNDTKAEDKKEDIEKDNGELNYNVITQYPLLKGGVIVYSTLIKLSDDVSKYRDGEYKVKINDLEFPVKSQSSLDEEAKESSDTLGQSMYTINIYK